MNGEGEAPAEPCWTELIRAPRLGGSLALPTILNNERSFHHGLRNLSRGVHS